MGFDFAYEKDKENVYDFVIENGTFKEIDAFTTTLIITALGEKRADNSEQPVNYLQRGWWGNTLNNNPGIEIGSKMWLLYQARNTQKTLNLAVDFLRNAFGWYTKNQYAQALEVTGEFLTDNFGLDMMIRLKISRDNVSQQNYEFWQNTAITQITQDNMALNFMMEFI